MISLRRPYSPLLSTLAIFCWWLIAFKSPVADEPHFIHTQLQDSRPHEINTNQIIKTKSLVKIKREEIAAALKGDTAQMGKLILDWNMDADILEQETGIHVKRLDKETLMRSQVLARLLNDGSEKEIAAWNEEFRKKLIIDDVGHPINLEQPPAKLLPQTFMAAEILLSLADHSQITALPRGFRTQTTLFNESELSSIDLNIAPYTTEKLYLARPDIALVAQNFSHPASMEAMRILGVELYTTVNIEGIDDIKKSIDHFGHIANTPLKAELLNIFIEAALNAIDNRRNCELPNLPDQQILIVNFHSQFSLPGKRTLTSSLIERMGLKKQIEFSKSLDKDNDWSIPVCEEQIYMYNPQFLLVITTDTQESASYFNTLPAFQNTQARLNHMIHVLDEKIQRSVSHQILLAYYDLNNALIKLDE